MTSPLVACSTGTSSETRSFTVPALWYSGNGPETKQGIAQVEVSVGVNPSGDKFDLDLETEKAQGAGPDWTAASWSAASVATLFSFRDPKTVEMSISVDGSIDGPSAGALLAATMLSLFAEEDQRSDVSMTGTINPDGSVGYVSGIPAKIRAAKDAGIKKVLIPEGLSKALDPATNKLVNVIEQGKKLGIKVMEVATVFEAAAMLTGGDDITPRPHTEKVAIQSAMLDSLNTSSKELESMIHKKLKQLKTLGVASTATSEIRKDYTTGSQLLRRGSVVEAYSRLSQANYAANAAIEVEQTEQRIKTHGVEKVNQEVEANLEDLRQENRVRLDSAANLNTKNRQQVVGLPDALAWGTDSAVEYAVYQRHLEVGEPNKEELLSMSRGISTFSLDSEVSLRQATAALLASGNTPSDEQAVTAALAGYSEFLTQTGDASMHYYEQVVAKLLDEEAKDSHRLAEYDYFAADLLRTRLHETADQNSTIAQQRTLLSMAMSYYVASATLVLKVETLGAHAADAFNTELVFSDNQGFERAVKASLGVNEELLEYLDENGIDSSYAHWGIDWGLYLANLPESTFNNSDRLLGLTYMWYSSLQLLLLNSQTVVNADSGG